MANPNGAGNAAMYAATGALNGIPAAGHYSDMQTLMQNMETLSGWLQQNREDFNRVQEGLEMVERRSARYPSGGPALPQINGDTAPSDSDTPTLTSVQRALDAANGRVASLEKTSQQHEDLAKMYEETLNDATNRLRTFVHAQSEHTLALHRHYDTLLAQSRSETLAAQHLHQDWQASLSRLNEELKKAVKARSEEKDPFRRKIVMLREENRILRQKVGWEVLGREEDEASESEEEVLPERVVLGSAGAGGGMRERERVLGDVMGQQVGR